MKPTHTTANPRIPGHTEQKGIFPTVYTRQLMVSGADEMTTDDIDAYVEAEQGGRDEDDGPAGALAPVGSQAR